MRYLKAFLFGLGIWCISFAIFGFIDFAVKSLIYPALTEWFPRIVPEYNFVNEREDYDRLYATMSVISALILICISSHVTMRLDNERMEYMITETEGLYTLGDGARIYYSRYLKADTCAAMLIPLPLMIFEAFLPLFGFLPEGALSLIQIPLEPTRAFTSTLGVIPAYLVMAVTFCAARLASGLRCIDLWRALWLSDIEYLG
jgi:hypothetical protein